MSKTCQQMLELFLQFHTSLFLGFFIIYFKDHTGNRTFTHLKGPGLDSKNHPHYIIKKSLLLPNNAEKEQTSSTPAEEPLHVTIVQLIVS